MKAILFSLNLKTVFHFKKILNSFLNCNLTLIYLLRLLVPNAQKDFGAVDSLEIDG